MKNFYTEIKRRIYFDAYYALPFQCNKQRISLTV